MSLAYSGKKSSLSEHLARDAFLAAMDDPEMELKIREREPPTLDDAVELVQRFEVFKSTVGGSLTNRCKAARKINEEENDPKVADMESRIAQLEKNIHAACDKRNEASSLPPAVDDETRRSDASADRRPRANRRSKQFRVITERIGRMILWQNLEEVTTNVTEDV